MRSIRSFVFAIAMMAGAIPLTIQAKPTCSTNTLTDNCKLFDPSKEFIQTKDGKKIPNFSFSDKEKWAKEQKIRNLELESKSKTMSLNSTVTATQILAKKMSPQAVINLSSSPPVFELLAKIHSGEASPQMLEKKAALWWPLNSSRGKVQEKTLGDVDKYLKENFTAKDIQTLEKFGKVHANQDGIEAPALYHPLHQEASAAELNDMVKSAKDEIIGLISAGRPEAALSPREKDAIERVRTIGFDPTAKVTDKDCASLMPNAFYSSDSHSFTLCPGFRSWPRESLMMVIGHEIAHSIDPCLAQQGLVKIDSQKARAFIKAKASPGESVELATDLLDLKSSYMNTRQLWEKGLLNSPVLEPLYEHGILRDHLRMSTYATYPFSSVSGCLASKEGGGFRSSNADHEAMLNAKVDTGALDGDEKDRLAKAYKDHPECLAVNGKNSMLGEATADWFGAKVAAADLKKRGKTLEGDDKAMPAIYFLNQACASKQSKPSQTSLINDLAKMNQDSDEHPLDLARLDNLVLRDPGLAEVFGCEPSGKACEMKANSARSDADANDEGAVQ